MTLAASHRGRLLRRRELLDREPMYRLQALRRLRVHLMHGRGVHRMLRMRRSMSVCVWMRVPVSVLGRVRHHVYWVLGRRGGV